MNWINTKDVIGEQTTFDGLVSRSLTSFTDSDVVELRSHAFYSFDNLEEVILPNLKEVEGNIFNGYKLIRFVAGSNQKENRISGNQTSFSDISKRTIIYVPDELLNSYIDYGDTYFNVFAKNLLQLRGISDYNTRMDEWEEIEISDTWEQIIEKISNNTAATSYRTGNYKPIDMGDAGIIRFQIIGRNVDEISDSDGKAQLSWYTLDLPNVEDQQFGIDGETTGYSNSLLKTYIEETMWSLLPENIRDVIQSVKKTTKEYSTEQSKLVENVLNLKLWPLSKKEVDDRVTYPQALFYTSDYAYRKKYGSTSSVDPCCRDMTSSSWIYMGTHMSGSLSNTVHVGFGFCT